MHVPTNTSRHAVRSVAGVQQNDHFPHRAAFPRNLDCSMYEHSKNVPSSLALAVMENTPWQEIGHALYLGWFELVQSKEEDFLYR